MAADCWPFKVWLFNSPSPSGYHIGWAPPMPIKKTVAQRHPISPIGTPENSPAKVRKANNALGHQSPPPISPRRGTACCALFIPNPEDSDICREGRGLITITAGDRSETRGNTHLPHTVPGGRQPAQGRTSILLVIKKPSRSDPTTFHF